MTLAIACGNATEEQVYEDLQVLEVAARCGRVVVLPLVLVLAGLMELGSVVVCSLFSRLSDSIEARDQHAGAASLRPAHHCSPKSPDLCIARTRPTLPIRPQVVAARETVTARKGRVVSRVIAGRWSVCAA